jgi:hypothetical protein
MRKQLLAMASTAALGLAVSVSGPAGAIQLTPGAGNAPDASVIQVQDKRHFGGGRGAGPGISARGPGGPSGGPGISARGMSGPIQLRGPSGGDFQPRGQVQTRNFSSDKFEARGQVQSRNLQKRDVQTFKKPDSQAFRKPDFKSQNFPRGEVRRGDWDKKDFSRWSGNKPHIVHRGWDRHHKHRFFGAFLIGVPFGYYVVASNPCYDWIYGPQGWGYYWNYDRCPVVPL